jgi:hypothetical protein
MADGSGHIAEFSKVYRQRAHENQRIGMTPQSMPRLEEVEEMLKQSERIQMSLQRMRDVVFNHHQASMVQPPQDSHYRPVNGYDADNTSNYGDDAKAGGFANGDNKRKRGVSSRPISPPITTTNHYHSEPLHQDDATAATAPRLQNGVEDRTAPGPCVTLVVCVSFNL